MERPLLVETTLGTAKREDADLSTSAVKAGAAVVLQRAGFEPVGTNGELFRLRETYCRIDNVTQTVKPFVRLEWANEDFMSRAINIQAGTREGEMWPHFLVEVMDKGKPVTYEGQAYCAQAHHYSAPPIDPELKGIGIRQQLEACGCENLGKDSCGTTVYKIVAGKGVQVDEFLIELHRNGQLGGVFRAEKRPGIEGMDLDSAESFIYKSSYSFDSNDGKPAIKLSYSNDLHSVEVDLLENSSSSRRTLLRVPTLEEMDVSAELPKRDRSGFLIAGVNESLDLQEVSEINGIAVTEIEKRMREGPLKILGPYEGLLNRMAEDNETVLEADLSHQKLAWPLKLAFGIANMAGRQMEFNGRGFRLEMDMYQCPPLKSHIDPEVSSNQSLRIINDRGETLRVWGGMPQLIERLGFYGGVETEAQRDDLRLDPSRIAGFFGIEGKAVSGS